MNYCELSYNTAVELSRINIEPNRHSRSVIGLNINELILPLTLESFQAGLSAKIVHLWWSTTNETSSTYFEVTRSTNAVSFESIGIVKAKNGVGLNNYSFTDESARWGQTYFYKLKMFEKNGSHTFSGIITIQHKTTAPISAYPNPTTNSFVLSHPLAGNEGRVKILNNEGKPLLKGELQAGSSKTGIDVGRLPRGNYFIVFENELEKQVAKFSKF